MRLEERREVGRWGEERRTGDERRGEVKRRDKRREGKGSWK